MNFQLNSTVTIGRLAAKYAITILAGVCLFSFLEVAIGAEQKPTEHDEQADHKFADRYLWKLDPASKQKLGEATYNEIMVFFDTAEDAIEQKDLKALMATYSKNYQNGDKDKKAIEEMWKRIFARFETFVSVHNEKLVNVSADKHMVVIRCTGLLLAKPDPKKDELVTIDNWSAQDHVLVKEAGKWKLIGNVGEERKRLWFDKPMHPLF